MFSRLLIIFMLICSTLSAPVYASKPTIKDRLKNLFYQNTVKTKPLQVKTIPAGAACTPDIPKNCDVKK